VYISARVDYAVRALLVLAAAGEPMRGEAIAAAQDLPTKVVENILVDLRRSGLVQSRRGPHGGYRLGRPAGEIAVADVIRTLEGPLAEVHGLRPDQVSYGPPAEDLRDVWVALRSAMRLVLENVTLADIAAGSLPREVRRLIDSDDAYLPRRLGPSITDRPG
jgi:Rrf2 family protein